MTDPHKITASNLVGTLPSVLAGDTSTSALGEAAARLLADRPAEISQLLIYARIDELPEKLLDILAYDFHIDWWDADAPLEAKRRTLRDSWKIHRMLGTNAAITWALQANYPDTVVTEWFDYDGEPFHFRVQIVDPENYTFRAALRVINWVKRLSAHLDEIRVTYTVEPGTIYYAVSSWYPRSRTTLPRLNILRPVQGTIYTAAAGTSVIKTTLPRLSVVRPVTGGVYVGAAGVSVTRTSLQIPPLRNVEPFDTKTYAAAKGVSVTRTPLPHL